MTEQVLIDFTANFDQLDAGIDQLEKLGQVDAQMAANFKKTTLEIINQANALKNTGGATAPLVKNIQALALLAKNVGGAFEQGFQEGVVDALKDAGVTLEEFLEALEKSGSKGGKATQTLKQQLKEITEQLAQAKLNGQDFGEEYDRLKAKAGEIQDTLGDVRKEIRNTGSDTRVFDGLIQGAQGVVGVMGIAQGATALFGDENKELQQTLLKVNAAMAILQGLQSIQNLTLKDSALNQLLENRQLIIKNAQTVIANGLESESITIRIAATVAQKALNLVMAANPIGLVVVALAGLITAVSAYTNGAREAAAETAKLNAALSSAGENLNAEIEGYENFSSRVVAELKQRGALESDVQKESIRLAQQTNDARLRELDRLTKAQQKARNVESEDYKAAQQKINELTAATEKFKSEQYVKTAELQRQVQDESLRSYAATIDAQLTKAKEGSQKQLQLRIQQVAAEAAIAANAQGLTEGEREKIMAEAQQKQLQLQADFNKRQADLQIKNIEAQLVNAKDGSEEQFRLQQRLLNAQVQSELSSTQLSEAEKKAIREKGLQDQIKLQREYSQKLTQQQLADEISRNNAVLSQLKTNDDDRLLLQIANINAAAAAEAAADNVTADKRKEIYAKADADILAARKQFIDDQLNYQLQLDAAIEGVHIRSLERIKANERKSYADRILAAKELTTIQVGEIDKQIAALNEQSVQGLISYKDYILKYKQLVDQKAQIEEQSAVDIKQLQLDQFKQTTEGLIDLAHTILDVFSTINDVLTQQSQNRIKSMQDALDAAKDAGAITEKDATARQKRIDAETKKAQTEQAVREKKIATFNAVLAIPEAFLKGLTTGGPILGAVYAALAGVQAVLIASKPIPKFNKGKKDRYEGWGEIAEVAPEILERRGKKLYVSKPMVTYLEAGDKVYTPAETQKMLSGSMPHIDEAIMKPVAADKSATNEIKGMRKDIRSLNKNLSKLQQNHISVDQDGFTIFQQKGLSRQIRRQKRYSTN